jgi:hypothetical protein
MVHDEMEVGRGNRGDLEFYCKEGAILVQDRFEMEIKKAEIEL